MGRDRSDRKKSANGVKIAKNRNAKTTCDTSQPMGNAMRLRIVNNSRFAAGQTKENSPESPPASQNA